MNARSRNLTDRAAVAVAVGAVVGAVAARPVGLAPGVLAGAAAFWCRRPGLLVVAVTLVASTMAARAWEGVQPGPARAYAGPATLVGDPARRGPVVHAVLEVEGRRYDVWAAGSPGRRLEARSAMQVVWAEGRLRPAPAHRQRRLAVRHVVGEFAVDRVMDWSPGSPLARSTERLRSALESGARQLDATDRSLFLGLVLGDDRHQPETLVEDFRRAGLGHLTAVSGQNVAFLLAVAGPALRRLRPWPRWAVTVTLLAWFAALTRFEPSVLRATVMAGISATAFGLGRRASPLRLLALTVSALLVVDPFLVWSVGFWLSTAATLGIVVFAAPITAALPGPVWLRVPIGVSLAAQLGVAPVVWKVFGGEPVAALPANVLAEPAAAFAMTWGLPGGLAAAALPDECAALIHGPTLLCVRWLRFVARAAAALDHPAWRPAVGVAHLLVAGWVWWRWRSARAVGSPVVESTARVLGPGAPPAGLNRR